MRTDEFDYSLPEELIAQRPARPRDSSRLMLLDRTTGSIRHLRFHQLPELLKPGDALVLNETRVLPVRLHAAKQPGGGKVELLLLARRQPQLWEAMVGGKGLKPGRRLVVDGGPAAEVIEDLGGPRRLVRFATPIAPLLDTIGETPLPPYIHRAPADPDEYQTVYARHPGSAAAPTAGFHFTGQLLERLRHQGVELLKLTLHVGLDTFAPVTEADPERHPIHSEWCEVSEQTVERIEAVRAASGRVIAVGTTSVRALETAAQLAAPGRALTAFQGATDLFILPGFEFQVVDAMITNFHLPRSTLLMLASAFAGRERVMDAYRAAIEQRYRFYSYGDAMLIL